MADTRKQIAFDLDLAQSVGRTSVRTRRHRWASFRSQTKSPFSACIRFSASATIRL